VTSFRKRVGVPGLAAVAVAAALMAMDDAFGPPPHVLPFKYGAIVIHFPWLLALLPIGAGATLLARRLGATFSERLLVALSPALLIGGIVNSLMAVVVALAKVGGQRVHPIDFIGHFIVGWLVFPAVALLLGSLPFLGDGVPGRNPATSA